VYSRGVRTEHAARFVRDFVEGVARAANAQGNVQAACRPDGIRSSSRRSALCLPLRPLWWIEVPPTADLAVQTGEDIAARQFRSWHVHDRTERQQPRPQVEHQHSHILIAPGHKGTQLPNSNLRKCSGRRFRSMMSSSALTWPSYSISAFRARRGDRRRLAPPSELPRWDVRYGSKGELS
jgi:hypothetical protein